MMNAIVSRKVSIPLDSFPAIVRYKDLSYLNDSQ